jgi:hypothetical protein
MYETYEVRQGNGTPVATFSADPDPRGRALRYADAMRHLWPSLAFEVWAVTRGSVSTDSKAVKL